MNVWAKMITALRGGLYETGEAIVDSQALRILDQEVRDAADALQKSREALTNIIAQQKLAEEKCTQIKVQISEYEGYALKALEKSDDDLALEIAEKIAVYEHQWQNEQGLAASHAAHAQQLRESIKHAEVGIKRLKQQIDTVKATENVQRAQAAVAQRYSGSNSKLRTAMDSLERIKEKQALNKAKIQAAQELSADEVPDIALRQKLEKAGIAPRSTQAADILARLRRGENIK